MNSEPVSKATAPKRTEAYYEKLVQLLQRPEVLCVAVRGDEDYQTLEAVCAEQQRRATLTGNPLGYDMPVCVLGDELPDSLAKNARIFLRSEGLNYGDLWVEQKNLGESIRCLVEEYGIRRPSFLTHSDEGSIAGYTRQVGDGWTLYEDEAPGLVNYGRMSEGARREFFEQLREPLP